MKKYIYILASITIIFCVFIIYRLTMVPSFEQSFVGRHIRSLSGEPIAKQISNELGEQLEKEVGLELLQNWAVDLISQYELNGVPNTSDSEYYLGTIKLPAEVIPDYLSGLWDAPPEFSLRLNDSGEIECIVICWYLHGVFIGNPNYKPSILLWYINEICPGVYVFAIYK